MPIKKFELINKEILKLREITTFTNSKYDLTKDELEITINGVMIQKNGWFSPGNYVSILVKEFLQKDVQLVINELRAVYEFIHPENKSSPRNIVRGIIL